MKDVFGIPVIESDLVDPDKVYVYDGQILAAPGMIQRLIFLNEIRSIVQRGIKAAHPWLEIPRRSTRTWSDGWAEAEGRTRGPAATFLVQDEMPPIYQDRPHRADGHACMANMPPPLGRYCNWCGSLPFVRPNTPEGPIERVDWDSERAKDLYREDQVQEDWYGDSPEWT